MLRCDAESIAAADEVAAEVALHPEYVESPLVLGERRCERRNRPGALDGLHLRRQERSRRRRRGALSALLSSGALPHHSHEATIGPGAPWRAREGGRSSTGEGRSVSGSEGDHGPYAATGWLLRPVMLLAKGKGRAASAASSSQHGTGAANACATPTHRTRHERWPR